MQKRFNKFNFTAEKKFRTNLRITAPTLVVIDDAGNNLGTMSTSKALQLAEEQEMDLIEVSPLANPPVARIMDFGKWQYLQSQKIKKQKTLDTKNIRLSFKIGDHDLEVRKVQTEKFLEKGHKVKIELRLRGREKAFGEAARTIVRTFISNLAVPTLTEGAITIMGGTVSALISKKH